MERRWLSKQHVTDQGFGKESRTPIQRHAYNLERKKLFLIRGNVIENVLKRGINGLMSDKKLCMLILKLIFGRIS